MKYVEQVLQPGETVAYATSLHWLVYLRPIVLLVLSGLLVVVLGRSGYTRLRGRASRSRHTENG